MAGNKLSLYALESDLGALLECAETVTPEQEAQYRAELAEALQKTTEKRDRVAQFLAHCESQAELAKAEIKRLQDRRQFFERAAERMKSYVSWIIREMGPDEKGAWRKLEGKTATLSLRKMPDVLQVDDEASIPPKFKTLVIEVPAAAWERHIEQCGDKSILDAVLRTEVKLDRRGLLAALKEGTDVPGADIRLGDYGLSLR
jgi:hypothetical protein